VLLGSLSDPYFWLTFIAQRVNLYQPISGKCEMTIQLLIL